MVGKIRIVPDRKNNAEFPKLLRNFMLWKRDPTFKQLDNEVFIQGCVQGHVKSEREDTWAGILQTWPDQNFWVFSQFFSLNFCLYDNNDNYDNGNNEHNRDNEDNGDNDQNDDN